MAITKIIEEFSDEEKFASRIQDYLNNIADKKHTIHYGITHSGKGFLYSALIVSRDQ